MAVMNSSEDRTGIWKRWLEVLLASMFLIGVTVGFLVVGARGPRATQGSTHTMYMCVVPQAESHIWNVSMEMVDEEVCEKTGRKFVLEEEDPKHIPYYPLGNIIFYSYVPHLRDRVMSREFEFLIMDLQLQFMYSKFIKEFMDKGHNSVHFEVGLGYRDGTSGPWKRKAMGNVTRLLDCRTKEGFQQVMSCSAFPLLELGSCHHKQYLVNFYFKGLPLGHVDKYRGLSQLARVNLFGIYQTPRFTRLWLWLKTILFPISLLGVLLFFWRLVGVARMERRSFTMLEKFLGLLGVCLVFLNIPFQYLSLYFDCPWLLVLNDFRQGLFIASLLSFWLMFVAEHNPEKDPNTSVGHYWKQLLVVSVASVFMFVYEFCERGIQVVLPFYSLWATANGIAVAYMFLGIASTSALLYLLIFLKTLYRTHLELRKKQNELQGLSESSSARVAAMFGSLRFFLFLTTVVAVSSLVTYVLPGEIFLHLWQHNNTEYNIYSGMLTGNYGMWNAYCLVMLYFCAPAYSKARATATLSSTMATDQATLQKLLAKKSQS